MLQLTQFQDYFLHLVCSGVALIGGVADYDTGKDREERIGRTADVDELIRAGLLVDVTRQYPNTVARAEQTSPGRHVRAMCASTQCLVMFSGDDSLLPVN